MSGPEPAERVSGKRAEHLDHGHAENLRLLAEEVESDPLFAVDDPEEGAPDGLEAGERRAIAALLRAKADKIDAHLYAIDALMSDDFDALVKAVEWRSTCDYGTGKVAQAWREYDDAETR